MPTIDTDTTATQSLNQMTFGDSGKNQQGIVPGDMTSDYATGDVGVVEALAYGTPIGGGELTAWAYVGETFDVTGSTSRDFTVTANGLVNGEMVAGFGGTSTTDIELICRKKGSSVEFDEVIKHVEASWPAGAEDFIDANLSEMGILSVNLDPGNTYEILLKLTVSASVNAIGGASSDYDDTDYDDHQITVDRFDFDAQ